MTVASRVVKETIKPMMNLAFSVITLQVKMNDGWQILDGYQIKTNRQCYAQLQHVTRGLLTEQLGLVQRWGGGHRIPPKVKTSASDVSVAVRSSLTRILSQVMVSFYG